MRLEFRSEEERNEFLIFNDLWVAEDRILNTLNQRVGHVEKSNSIELITKLDDLDHNVQSSSGWWASRTSVSWDAAPSCEISAAARRRLTRLSREGRPDAA